MMKLKLGLFFGVMALGLVGLVQCTSVETKQAEMVPTGTCSILGDKSVFLKLPSELVPQMLREAGSQILAIRKSDDLQSELKKDASDIAATVSAIKTKADCTSQNYIFSQLSKAYPNQRFIGEEKCGNETFKSNPDSKIAWLLDPIDGTTNFVHGMPHFAISLALVVDKEICYGAVYAPVYEEIFQATKGQGTFLVDRSGESRKLAVSPLEDIRLSLWITGFEAGSSKKAQFKNAHTFAMAKKILKNSVGIRRSGSASLDLAFISAGRASAYFELGEGLGWWDISAGLLLVTEAGGKVFVREPKTVTKTSEAELDRPILGVLATNGAPSIHQRGVELLSAELGKNKGE